VTKVHRPNIAPKRSLI